MEQKKKYNTDYTEYKRMFRMFKEEYPTLVERGTTFEPYGYQEIRVYIPGRGKLIYNTVGTESGKIRWEEYWINEKEIAEDRKQELIERRAVMYQTFLREIHNYQRETGTSQSSIARITGISRKSINEYLSGSVAPKISTMKTICETLGIDI